ncbi:MAG: ferritin-like domain-containing protein [Peptococcaceae bacterium]|nr:ferritin-like domain-containing protein [Peptococcaceae bacterium]
MAQSALVSMILEAYRDERAADVFYTRFLEENDGFESVDALAEARRDERQHARTIRDLIFNLTGSYPPETDYPIPAYQGFEEAIRIALANEREAVEFYNRLIDLAESKQIKDIFILIREDEIVHALKFEALLAELK